MAYDPYDMNHTNDIIKSLKVHLMFLSFGIFWKLAKTESTWEWIKDEKLQKILNTEDARIRFLQIWFYWNVENQSKKTINV